VQLQKTTYFHINYKLQAIKIVREKLHKKGLDTKGVIRIRKSKTMQDNELHRKPRIEKHEPHKKRGKLSWS
jgi:hypothetical protein